LEAASALGMSAEIFLADAASHWKPGLFERVEAGITAIACWNDELAREVVSTFVDAGYDVPGRIAVTGFDGCPAPLREALPLTTIAAPWAEAGRSAVLALNARLSGETVSNQLVLPERFIQGLTS
jgi:DNA-binding LacI/PurR family transcriptional regulator